MPLLFLTPSSWLLLSFCESSWPHLPPSLEGWGELGPLRGSWGDCDTTGAVQLKEGQGGPSPSSLGCCLQFMDVSCYSSFQIYFISLSPGPCCFQPKANGSCGKSSCSQHCHPGKLHCQGEAASPAASPEHPPEPGRATHPCRGHLRQQQLLRQ